MEIIISAQIFSTGVFTEEGESIYKEETDITEKTWNELQNLVILYEDIIPFDPETLEKKKNLIAELDAKGMAIAKKIKDEWKYDKKTNEELNFIYLSQAYITYIKVE